MAEQCGTVMFFDTIVGTNKYNLVRGTLSIQLNNGRITPIAYSLLSNQEKETFLKFFETVFSKLLKPPKFLLTDQDKAILSASNQYLKNKCYHVDCNCHAQENAKKHLAPLLSIDTIPEIPVEKKISMHSEVLELFNEISQDKALKDIEFLRHELPESDIKSYVLSLVDIKEHIFPSFYSRTIHYERCRVYQ